MVEQDTPPPTITAMKIPIIKKGEYDIWSMRMRQYICHTYHNLWDIIVNGNLQEEVAPAGEQSSPPAPKTAKQLAAKRNQERVKSILLLAIPKEYLLKFHNVPNAKSLWDAIKSRFGGNDESKKMHRNVLKHQFENFTTTPNESLDKGYDRFQKLISQLEVYAAPVSKEDINQKFLRSLPPSWSQIAFIMRNKPNIDQTDIDDLYNNLRVYEDKMKRSLSSTSNSQNLAFLSSENTSSTNEVCPASGNFRVNTTRGTSSSSQVSSTPGADEVVCSFFAQQTTSPPLDNEDLQQIDQDDLEELDIRCQWIDNKHNEPSSQALVAQDGLGGYDWSNDFNEPVNYALMAISSSSSSISSDNKVQNYSKQCLKSFKALQKNYDSEREKHSRARLEIQGYELALESLESRIILLLGHEKMNWLWGFGTQLDDWSNKFETDSEISMSIFEVRSSDEEITPANDRLDEYAIRKKIIKSKTTEPKDDTSESKTSETVGKTNEVEKSKPKINIDKVIIEDWNSDDEDDVSEVNTVSPAKTNETQTVKTQVDKIGQISQKEGIGFKKIKACFVCKSIDHLIKDCDFYAKNSPEPKLKTVVNTDQTMVKPVWDNAKKKNSVLFTDTECLILSPSFKLLDESQVILRAPRQNDVYNLDLKNIIPFGGITCLYANATSDESKLWHRRLGHVNFKIIDKFVKGHLVRGLPFKVFVNDHTCVACKKGKQHKASCKAKLERTIRKPLELLHMDLFGHVSVESINKKKYCLVVTDDFSRFSWVFFLATKDETNEILYKFITGLENQLNHKVKIIRCDHGTEFKNHAMNELCAKKGIKREFSVARTPQQNGVAERKNRTLIEAARTMLADYFLPNLFLAEGVNTALNVLNRVLVTKP
ncbi:putative ribonuclease H-like domain-containing protein [Tanacetum coccineum]